MAKREANASAKIIFLPAEIPPGREEKEKIREIVRERLLLTNREPYLKAQVAVKRRRDELPQYLVVFMLRAYTYSADVYRVNVEANYDVKSVQLLSDEAIGRAIDDLLEPPSRSSLAVGTVDMIFGTSVPEIPSAVAAVQYACNLARSEGYIADTLIGRNANVANYKRYLTSGLKAFGHVGHGTRFGLNLSDAILPSSWFNGLTARPLAPAVVYFNSCDSYNDPLQPAIMRAGARTFIGGTIHLAVGRSEDVFNCFWDKILDDRREMEAWLTRCEISHYTVRFAHKLDGDDGLF